MSPPSQTVTYGATATFTVTTNAGYTAAVSEGTLSGSTWTIPNITSSHTVTVTFTKKTNMVTVLLKDSKGNPLSGGVVQYYSSGWQAFGTTDASGQVTKELSPLTTYSFRMSYASASLDKSQNVATNPTVAFQTGQVHSDSGSCISYYAGGWHVFIQNIELLPVAYSFRFNDGTANTSYTITSGTVNHIH